MKFAHITKLNTSDIGEKERGNAIQRENATERKVKRTIGRDSCTALYSNRMSITLMLKAIRVLLFPSMSSIG